MQTWYRVAAGAIGWFVNGLHYYLIASRPDVGLAEAASRTLSFFPDRHPSGARHDAAQARAGIEIRGVLLASVGANGDHLLHHCTIEHCVAPALYIGDAARL